VAEVSTPDEPERVAPVAPGGPDAPDAPGAPEAEGEAAPHAPSRRERAQDWLDERREQIEAARSTSSTVNFAFDAYSYDTESGAPVLAAALGFRVFLFAVPYVGFVLVVGGILSDITGRAASSYLHGGGIVGLIAQSIANIAALSGWARFTTLVLVAYALFLTSRSMVKVLRIVHALVWDVPRSRLRSTNRAAFGLVILITLLIALSIVISVLYDHSKIGGIIALLLYVFVPFAVWWFVSWWLPHRPCPLAALAPGAALFAIGAEILHLVTVLWFPHYFESKSELYGTIGTAIAMLLWAYLLGRLITLAAVLNAALWGRVAGESETLAVERPDVKLPLLDDKLTRLWLALFGTPRAGKHEDE
jgi:uncharacterized BrkB/YihY/UPF0761 family membrane protein